MEIEMENKNTDIVVTTLPYVAGLKIKEDLGTVFAEVPVNHSRDSSKDISDKLQAAFQNAVEQRDASEKVDAVVNVSAVPKKDGGELLFMGTAVSIQKDGRGFPIGAP
jgi:uncharacterized protein YbjQ (UPF0145 family)